MQNFQAHKIGGAESERGRFGERERVREREKRAKIKGRKRHSNFSCSKERRDGSWRKIFSFKNREKFS